METLSIELHNVYVQNTPKNVTPNTDLCTLSWQLTMDGGELWDEVLCRAVELALLAGCLQWQKASMILGLEEFDTLPALPCFLWVTLLQCLNPSSDGQHWAKVLSQSSGITTLLLSISSSTLDIVITFWLSPSVYRDAGTPVWCIIVQADELPCRVCKQHIQVFACVHIPNARVVGISRCSSGRVGHIWRGDNLEPS